MEYEAPFALTAQEKQSALWARLAEHFAARLDVLRKENDDPGLGQFETAAKRGHIKCLKSILDLGKDLPPYDGEQ